MGKRAKLFSICTLASIALAWFAAANPFNLFVERSSQFSMEEFLSIRPGSNIDDAIAKLGEPIKIVRSDSDLGCPGCATYYFLGNPPQWLWSFQEAWLVVDRGRVTTSIVNSEP